jgi:hypothetical protein
LVSPVISFIYAVKSQKFNAILVYFQTDFGSNDRYDGYKQYEPNLCSFFSIMYSYKEPQYD